MTPLFSTLPGSILLGACVGSFLNVCISRWKSGEQIIFSSSHCPYCCEFIRWYDNIPLLSFILLRAKCRFCNKPISWQYPLVEIITAVLFGLSFYCFRGLFLVTTSYFFVSFIVLLVVSDLKWKLLPHPFTNLFIFSGLFFSKGYSMVTYLNLFQAVSNFMLLGFLLYGMTQIIPNGLGGGDIKMGAGLTIWLGLSKSLMALLLAFGLGSFMVLPLFLLKRITKKSMIPFGPFLAGSSILLWFWPEMFNQIGIGL